MLEALLLVVDTPVTVEQLAAVTEQPAYRRPRLLTAPDHHRLLTGSGRQPDRGHLRRFLAAPQVEPTHKRAARVVRPAVSARQGSQCSKNQAGAQAVAACKRVGQTLAQQGVNSMGEGRYGIFRSARPHAAPP